LILAARKDGVEKIDGGVLLKLDAVANAVGECPSTGRCGEECPTAAEESDWLRSVFIEKLKSPA